MNCHVRAASIASELARQGTIRRAELMLELIGCLAAEAVVLVGRERIAEAIYHLADTVVGEDRVSR